MGEIFRLYCIATCLSANFGLIRPIASFALNPSDRVTWHSSTVVPKVTSKSHVRLGNHKSTLQNENEHGRRSQHYKSRTNESAWSDFQRKLILQKRDAGKIVSKILLHNREAGYGVKVVGISSGGVPVISKHSK